jgi:hypothetical protein
MGFSCVYLDDIKSRNVISNMKTPFVIPQFIHAGGSCGYSGGCNNGSPFAKELILRVDSLPARAYLKLWKNKPSSKTDPPDMIFIIEMI